MGMAVGCNVGDDHAMFEPIHGSAPPLAGKDKANPMAMLLATGEALAWLATRYGDERLARGHKAIESAVAVIVSRGTPLTSDLGGTAGSQSGRERDPRRSDQVAHLMWRQYRTIGSTPINRRSSTITGAPATPRITGVSPPSR